MEATNRDARWQGRRAQPERDRRLPANGAVGSFITPRALVEISEPADEFVRAASRRILKRSDW